MITALRGDSSAQKAGRIRSVKRHPNSKMQMEINGEAGEVYVLEAPANFVDWRPICVVRPDEEGNCGYEDVVAGKLECRFHRVREP